MHWTTERSLDRWQEQGLLTDEKVVELRASLTRGDSARGIRIFAAIGAVLAGLGAIWSSRCGTPNGRSSAGSAERNGRAKLRQTAQRPIAAAVLARNQIATNEQMTRSLLASGPTRSFGISSHTRTGTIKARRNPIVPALKKISRQGAERAACLS